MAVRELNRVVPSGYEPMVQDAEYGIEVFADMNRFCAIGFAGRRNSPDFRYRFSNAERLNAYVAEYVERIRGNAQYRAQQRAQRVEASRQVIVSVGDIFRSSWGYEQTNIDYYQVVAVRGRMIDVRPIGQQREGNGCPDQGYCVPVPDSFVGEAVRSYRAQGDGQDAYFRVASYANAYRISPIAVIAGIPIYEQSHWTAYY